MEEGILGNARRVIWATWVIWAIPGGNLGNLGKRKYSFFSLIMAFPQGPFSFEVQYNSAAQARMERRNAAKINHLK